MALQRPGKNLRPLNSQVNATILNGRNGGLGNASELGELILAELLQLANDAHGVAN